MTLWHFSTWWMSTHFNAVRLVSGKKSAVVLRRCRVMWPFPYFTPKKITLESMGEFFLDIFAEEVTPLGIKPRYAPRGPRAFLVEETHGPIGSAERRSREEHPHGDMNRVLIDVINVVDYALGPGGLVPDQAVFGRGISDVASALLGRGDHHRNDDAPQDPSTRGPFLQALRLRGAATFEIRRGVNEQRVRRMLGHNAQYTECHVRVGDCAVLHRARAEKDGEMSEARRFGPAEVVHSGWATRHLIYFGETFLCTSASCQSVSI